MSAKSITSNLSCDVLVLGAGISGLSTAIILQSMGMNVALASETTPLKSSQDKLIPDVPTNYAMASAYPHFLRVDGLEEISDITQALFKQLSLNTNSGVSIQEIFEVFEYEPESAPLKNRRMNFQEFDGSPRSLKSKVNPPARQNAEYLWGWVFDSYFCDMPVYIPYLWQLFESNQGQFINTKVDQEFLESMPDNILVANCLGAGAIKLYKDSYPAKIQRGCQILLKDGPPVLNERGLAKAFNYFPTKEVFPRNLEEAEYLHFFARSDGWLLGQTREVGNFDEDGNWVGQKLVGEYLDIDGTPIPKPLLDLNLDILKSWNIDPINQAELVARIGYRYYRDPDNTGVRLEVDSCFGNKTVHNYAHGGSGITMSWGCAVKAAQKLVGSSVGNGQNNSISADLKALQEPLKSFC